MKDLCLAVVVDAPAPSFLDLISSFLLLRFLFCLTGVLLPTERRRLLPNVVFVVVVVVVAVVVLVLGATASDTTVVPSDSVIC